MFSLRPLFPDDAPNAYDRNNWPVDYKGGGILECLTAHGVIADPWEGFGALGCRWVADVDWVASADFRFSESFSGILSGPGAWCHTKIFWNGTLVGETESPHETWALPVEVDVQNRLELHFSGPLRLGRKRREEYFDSEDIHPGTELFDERSFVRLPAHRFGWDWGPAAIEFGLIESIEVVREPPLLRGPRAYLEGSIGFVDWPECLEGELAPEFIPVHPGRWKIENPLLWWPRWEGPQNLYTASDPSSQQCFSFGFRSIELADPFQFLINGRKVYARGLNWTPTARGRFAEFEDFGQNMVRIWGGGEYPDRAFMEQCDREGVMVWMDFPYACGYVPESGPAYDAMQREATHFVENYFGHPSLVLWCGNNENDLMWDTKWGDVRPNQPYGEPFFHDFLAHLIPASEVYIPSSPMRGERDTHYWDVWHGKGDWSHVEGARCAFASEFGFASYTPGLAEQLRHFRNKSGKQPNDLLTLHYSDLEASNLNQRDAVRAMIEHFRLDPQCSGSLLWQSHEPWAGLTWAIAGKPAAQELPRLFAPTLVGVKNRNEVWAIHHGPDGAEVTIRVGEQLFELQLRPWEPKFVTSISCSHSVFIDYLSFRRVWLPCDPKDLPLQNPVFDGRMLVDGLAIDLQIDATHAYSLRPGESVPPGQRTHWRTIDGANGTFPETMSPP